MDGANLNALVGLCRPAEIGADVCHMNLHKTFCIPHGGGGPGMGPIAVKPHLASYLPGHPVGKLEARRESGPYLPHRGAVPAYPADILGLHFSDGFAGTYRCDQGGDPERQLCAKRLEAYYPVVYKGANGFVAHECILDLRALKKSAGIEVDDVAKRLMDYGFHAPTVSFPVAGTMMIEPTESESKKRTGSILRRDDRDSRGDCGDRNGESEPIRQCAEKCAPHGGGAHDIRMETPVFTRTGGLSGSVDARIQILAFCWQDRQCLRRSSLLLLLPIVTDFRWKL